MEATSSPPSSESDEVLALPIVDQDENYEPAPKKRILKHANKLTTPGAGTFESSNSESDDLLVLPIVHQGKNDEPAPRRRAVSYARKSTTPRARTSAFTPPARQQKSKISGLKGLSADQLINLIDKIIEKHPEIKNEVVGLIPLPDLTQFETKLEALKKNIDKSFPWSKYGSGRNAFCYQRVKTHLDTFQQECIQQCKTLIDYEQWNTSIDYVIIAFKYVGQLPEWDDPKHNKHKPECYKKLTLHLINALKKGTFDKQKLKELIARFKKFAEEGHNDSGMQNFIKLAETTLNKL